MSGTGGGNSHNRFEKTDWRGAPYRENRPGEWWEAEPSRRDDIAAQEQRLRGAVRMGDDRAMTQTGHWEGVPHQQMWDDIHDKNKPGDVFLDADRWTKLGNEMAERSGAMARAVAETASGWVGRGGDAARAGSLKLAEWAGDAAISLQYMGNRTADLGESAEWAKHAMPKPAERTTVESTFLNKAAGLAGLVDLGELKLKAQQAVADALHQEAVRVMQVNEGGTRSVDGSTPSFAPPPAVKGGGTPPVPSPSPPGPGDPGVPPIGRLPNGGGSVGGGGQFPGPTPDNTPPEWRPGQTEVQRLDPGRPQDSGGTTGSGGQGGQSGLGGLGGSGSDSGALGGLGAVGGLGALGGGIAGGIQHPPESTRRGPGLGQPGAGAANSAKAPGAQAMPAMSAGTTRKEDDKEHRRPEWLVETENVFGDIERVAPPVIGEDP
ncbi:hypothetical protein NLX83_21115 [Allokutzneria sp. A3M-2-11 16]|uniref:hypothetical protein n=1 Tax=Allokutzneria sp. A3M-2-11 16 TaxID=2962043 RepID=UPI0020B7C4AF|nr:hypothetical protein [Allokutzneria sp. A3M-2-11 16]MCP3801768.1 hypothetical protein [Allokutzneria sp. A3M-2-11 16]